MKPLHICIGLLATALWGLNFVVSKIGLQTLPPFLFTALRFATLAPCLFFVAKPKVPWSSLIALGMLWGVLQFALLNVGLSLGFSANLSALTMQSSVLFSVLFSCLALKERVTLLQILGLSIGLLGTLLIGFKSDSQATLLGFMFTFLASACWGLGNIVVKQTKSNEVSSLMIWSSAIAVAPLMLLSYRWEGTQAWADALAHISLPAVGCIFYAGLISTLFAGSLWVNLLQRYEASIVTPLSLFVPLFGALFSSLLLQETLSLPCFIAAGLIIFGFFLNYKARQKQKPFKGLRVQDNPSHKQPGLIQTRTLVESP